jgi:arginine utilization protein RocB
MDSALDVALKEVDMSEGETQLLSDVTLEDGIDEEKAAEHFMSTIGDSVQTLTKTNFDEASAGFKMMSKHSKETAKARWRAFREHTRTIDTTNGWRGVRDTAKGSELAQLPMAVVHAFMALIVVVIFASIFYPHKYVPPIKAKCEAKFEEWHVKEKAANAVEKVKRVVANAHAKALEKMKRGNDVAAEAEEVDSV